MKDIAGKKYWENEWLGKKIPYMINPDDSRKGAIMDRANNRFLHLYLDEYISTHSNIKFLEIGCGNSSYLPYIAKEFKISVYGLDYTKSGCESARRVAEFYEEEVEIRQGDMFAPPEDMLGAFDVIVSNGVIEHYDDTEQCCRAIKRFLKPGGICITSIPNTSKKSRVFKLQRIVNKKIYDIHYSIDREKLQKAHENVGLKTKYCDYTFTSNYGVVAFPVKRNFFMEQFRKLICRWSKLLMLITKENLKGNEKSSPYIYYIGINE